MSQKVLVITGMHRSGTSVCANWLHKCGLDLGERLMINADFSNPDGYYEDYDFLDFHEACFDYNKTNYLVQRELRLEISKDLKLRAEEIIADRKNKSQWAWKDPRTCNFIKHWNSLIDPLYTLILFRSPEKTIDSILRRTFLYPKTSLPSILIKQMKRSEIKSYQRLVINSWIKHYECILKEHDPSYSIFISFDRLKADSINLFNFLHAHWGFNLKYHSIDTILRKGIKNQRPLLFDTDDFKKEFNACHKLYRILKTKERYLLD